MLIHGTRFDARAWRGYAAALPEAQVVALDLPGHGGRAGQEWSTEAALAVVRQAVDAAAPGQPVVLAGHSLGGYVAASYARQHPESLAVLVLIGATADPGRHPVLVFSYTGFARLIPVLGADRMASVANGVLRRLGLERDALPDATGYAVTPQAWASVVAGARADDLVGLDCPVYLVAGQYDQLRVDLRHYARQARRPRVRVIPRASHLAPLTHRAEVAAILREALAEAGSRGAAD